MKDNFLNSYHCTSKYHCASCRDIEDESFRQQLYDAFDDIHAVNFDCPYGVPWGSKNEVIDVPKKEKDDRDIVNIDMVISNRELFIKVDGLQSIIDEYNEKNKNNKCSSCLRARINRGINKYIVSHIEKNKDIKLLNSLNGDLILADGKTDKLVSEWRSEIKNVL